MSFLEKGLEEELSRKVKKRIVEHRNKFYKMIIGRYFELLPLVISYVNHATGDGLENDKVAIDYYKLEVALRNNWNLIIGKATNDQIMILGYAKSPLTASNPANVFRNQFILTKENFIPVVSKNLIPETMQEITLLDNAQTGNFVVLRNKILCYTSDYEIIEYYAEELAEIVTSRFSLSIQAKIMTIFKGEVGDESINEMIDDLYNGSAYAKVTKMFDPDEDIITIQNPGLSSNLTELKREYQNKMSELNNMLGISALGVDKTAGVSEKEAVSGSAYTTTNANIYLKSRQSGMNLLNKRYNLQIEAIYNDEIGQLFRLKEVSDYE